MMDDLGNNSKYIKGIGNVRFSKWMQIKVISNDGWFRKWIQFKGISNDVMIEEMNAS